MFAGLTTITQPSLDSKMGEGGFAKLNQIKFIILILLQYMSPLHYLHEIDWYSKVYVYC